MRYNVLGMVCAASASLSIVAALKANIYIAVALALFSTATFYLLHRVSRGGENRKDSDVIRFTNNLIGNYANSTSTLKLLVASLSHDLWFYKEMKNSILRYTADGNAERSFSAQLCSDSSGLREVTAAIVQRLDGGTQMLKPLKAVKRRLSSDNRYKLKSFGSVLNTNSIISLGSVLFFPMFAGISIQITQFAGMGRGIATVNSLGLVMIFAFYIIYVNIANFRYAAGDALWIEKSALSGAIGILVFKISSILSASML